jgi:hypothetical protein
MLKLFIPKPCHEDWGSMTPNEQGRHCAVCTKTVTDFTQMSDDEVNYFFLNKKQGERTCGRFTNRQLNYITIKLPANIYFIPMPLWKKFLAACLIIFSPALFSCNTNMKGDVVNTETRTTGIIAMPPQQQTLLGDTTLPYDMKGEPVMIDTAVKGKCSNIITVSSEETFVVGNLEAPPPIVQVIIAVAEQDAEQLKPVVPAKKDTLQKKDTINCNTQKFY